MARRRDGQPAAAWIVFWSAATCRRTPKSSLARQRYTGFGGEHLEKGPDGAAGEAEADEKEDRAERFVPPQVHEKKDDEEEFDRGKDDERRDEQPFCERQVDA